MGDAGRESGEQVAAAHGESRPRIAAIESEDSGFALTRLTDSMLDGFSILDVSGVHLDVNPALCDMTGFSREELIGEGPPHAYWPPEEYDAIEAAFSRTLGGDVRTFPLTFMRKSGERFPVLVSPAVLRDEAGAMVSAFATVKDVSELKAAEAALAESERLFRLTFEQSPIGAALVGLDLRFQRLNARFAQMTGYSAEELQELGFPDITHPHDVTQDVAALRRLASGEIEEYAREERYVCKDGSVAWGDVVVRPITGADDRPLAFIAMVADITARHRADEDLRESEERFKYVFDHSAVGKSLTLPTGNVNVNDAFCQMLGYSPEEMAHHTWQELTHPDDVAETEAQMARITSDASESVRFQKRYLKKDGSILWADVSSSLRRDDAGEPMYFITTIMDVTQRKWFEQLMSAPSEILGIIAATSSVREAVDGIVAALKEATGFDAVGLRLRVNDDFPFVGSLGYPDEFIALENTLAARDPEGGLCRDADGTISLECTCGLIVTGNTDPGNPLFTEGGSAWTNDSLPFLDVPEEDDPRLHPRNRCIHVGFRSLALVPLRAGEEILGLLHLGDRRRDRFTPETIGYFEGLGRSIGLALENRRAQEALLENEERYRTVADFTYDWEYWQAPNGIILYTSPSCLRITGYGADEFIADPGLLLSIVHPDDRERVAEHLIKHVGDADLHREDFRILTRAGETRWIGHACQRVVNASGEPLGRRASNRDITERKRGEDEIRRLNTELAERVVSRTEQLDATTRELEALAYSIAHDVRAPLRTIDGFSAMVIEDERQRLSPEGVSELRRVRVAAQTLARLLDELMGLSNVSRRDLLRLTVDVSALAENVGEEVAAESPSRSVELTVTPGLFAYADPALLRLILRELLGNAWKFTRHRQKAHVEVGALDEGDERAFYVRDDGAGFDMRYAEHLFGAFQRMHSPEEFEGVGIGLATVQRLVRRHGGRCWAEAQVESGATIYFTLPSPAPEG